MLVARELTRYVFWDCPRASIIVYVFSRVLSAAIAKLDKVKAAQLQAAHAAEHNDFVDLDSLNPRAQHLQSADDEVPEADSVVVILNKSTNTIVEVRL